jgi:hypothetical protein
VAVEQAGEPCLPAILRAEPRHADLVWRHPGTGDVALWTLTAGLPTGATILAFGVDPLWHLTAVEDTDADGHADFIWSQEGTGDISCLLQRS